MNPGTVPPPRVRAEHDRPVDAASFECLLASVSVRFARLEPDRVVESVRETVEQVREAFGYERATYSEFRTPDHIEVLCATASAGTSPLPVGLVEDDPRWFRQDLLAGRVIAFDDLPNGLPPHAAAQAERCARLGLTAHLSIPLRVGERTVAALSFAGIDRRTAWPPEAIRRLMIVGELVATALDRVRIQQDAAVLRDRLWHVERVARTSALACAFAHELSQPIAAILGNAQSELRYADTGRATPHSTRQVLEAIVRDVHRAADTIRSVRRLLRRDERTREPVDVGDAVREVLALVHAEVLHHRVRVALRADEDVRVEGNRSQLQQVMLNLVQNAFSAMDDTPDDERLLRIDVTTAPGGQARLRVEDAGRGVPDASAESIFEPLGMPRAERPGFGLAISRAIVESHGGTIRLEPGSARGAAFVVELPGHDAAGAARVATVAAPSTGDARFVAVVDDDASWRGVVRQLMENAGFAVRTWADGRTFLADGHLDRASCILLDVRMPGPSGLEVHRTLRERGVSAPVIYVTADDDVADGVDAMKRGAKEFLLKPVEADVLAGAVRAAVEHDAARRSAMDALATRRARFERLTGRERDVLREVVRGRLNKQIAGDLRISEPTVKQHRAKVMEKLEVRSVAELIRACEGVLPESPSSERPDRGAAPRH